VYTNPYAYTVSLFCLSCAGEMVETPHGVLEMPEFGLSEAEKAYHGPHDDRRALMAHRKWLQARL
jgi:hypothetical protein